MDSARWSDSDGDGIDDQIDDACPTIYGNSTIDRIGCPDTDGDGYSDVDSGWNTSDGADAFKTDPTQWAEIIRLETLPMIAQQNLVIHGRIAH
ncbi:MAG: hypothetical protein CXT67_10095 [Methanobacteriota archaeon]|nr:MAG: hypothetical protein CXT67_10095 [Euryarchaeota archaeon]